MSFGEEAGRTGDGAPPETRYVTLFRRPHLGALALVSFGVGLHAVNWYMTATAMPSAIQALGAQSYIGWLNSLYLIASILGGALLPPLKSRWGARRAVTFAALGIGLGAFAAGAAPGILVALLGRCLQGLAEGFLIALSYALVKRFFATAWVPKVFAILACVWAIAIIIGPLLGGYLTETFGWRAAFFAAALMPLPAWALAWRLLAGEPPGGEAAPAASPLPTLAALAVGIFAIALADKMSSAGTAGLSIAIGVGLIGFALAIDRRRPPHIFPTEFPSLSAPLSLGLWVLLLMPLSEAGVYVYVPYILQIHRDFSPMIAGYFGAIHAIAWSLSAMAVAALPARWHGGAILAGPTFLMLGLIGLALSLESAPLPAIVIAMIAVGAGFGISNTFLAQRVMALARPGAEDQSAAAIPTLEGLGAALSAAWVGILGNRLGLAGPLDAAIVAGADAAIFGTGAAIALLAVFFAWRMIRA